MSLGGRVPTSGARVAPHLSMGSRYQQCPPSGNLPEELVSNNTNVKMTVLEVDIPVG
jgi:hypothetical protein